MFCKSTSKLSSSLSIGDCYDAIADIGMVPDTADPTISLANRVTLNLAFDAMHLGGAFTFADGSVGPILKPIFFAAKPFFFSGVIKSSLRVGCGSLIGVGGRGYVTLEADYSNPAGVGGMTTRLIRIDGETGGPFIRVRGAGFHIAGMDIYGERWNGTVQTRSLACLQVEGRDAPTASGKHTFRDLNLVGANYAIQTVPGYYEDATRATTATTGNGTTVTLTHASATSYFVVGQQIVVSGVTPSGYNGTHIVTAANATTVSFANATTGAMTVAGTIAGEVFVALGGGNGVHADESIVENVHAAAVDSFFRCENEQSVGFTFYHCSALGNFNTPTVMFDYYRGGKLLAKSVSLLNGGSTLIKYRSPSHNSNWMQVDDFMYDNVDWAGIRTVTGASGTGLVATLTHANDANPPYVVGQDIIVSGVTPSGYNGTHRVISSTETTVSYQSTQAGAYTSGGSIQGGVGQFCTLFDYTHTDPNGIYYPVDVRVSGHIAYTQEFFDQRKLVQFDSALGSTTAIPNFERLLFDVTGMAKTDKGQQMWRSRGHWLYPDKAYFAPYMARNTDQLTIASGAITTTPELVQLVDTESAAASDDLDYIAGGYRGQEIVIRPKHTDRSVVLKKATANTTSLITYCRLNEPGSHGTYRYDSHGTNHFQVIGTHGIEPGKQNYATTFLDAGSNYATATNNASLQVGDIDATWHIRVKFDSLPAHNCSLFGKYGGSTFEYQLAWTSATNRVNFSASGTGAYTAGGNALRTIIANTFGGLAINTWYDIVCGHDATANKLFLTINGVAETDADCGTIGVYVGTNSLFLVDGYWGGASFPGCMEDFTFWKRRLSVNEIADLYGASIPQAYPFYSVAAGRKGNILIGSDTTLADLHESKRLVCDGKNWLGS